MRLKSIIASGLLALSLGVGVLAAFFSSPALAQSAVLLPNGKQQFLDSNGAPLAGGTVGFYVPPATLTPKTTWLDAARATPNSNPVTLDSSGEAIIYGVGSYRQIVKDALGATIWDAQTSGLGGSLYGGVSTGTANAQSLAASDFGSVDGSVVSWIAGFSNTGAMTLDAGAGAKTVSKITPTGVTGLTGGEVVAGGTYSASWSVSNNRFTLLNSTPIPYETRLPVTYNGSITASLSANTLVISLLGANGAVPSATNPVVVPFVRDTGVFDYKTITSSLTLTVPATCNLGMAGSAASQRAVWVYARDSAGGPTLAVSSPTGGAFDTTGAQVSAVSICGGGSGVFYGPTNSVVNLPVSLLGSVVACWSGATWNVACLSGAAVAPVTATPSLNALASTLSFQSALTSTTSGTLLNLSPYPTTPVKLGTTNFHINFKHGVIVLEGVSFSGVSALSFTPIGGCAVAVGFGTISTLGAATIATTNSTTAGALTAALVAANTLSGRIEWNIDEFTSPSSYTYVADLATSTTVQYHATGSFTCSNGILTNGGTIFSTNGVDTFDAGNAYINMSM